MTALRILDIGGMKLRVAIEGEGPLVIMVHGFPELWYSWRRQLGPVAAAGFTACAIDVRGYGGSDRPHAVEDYALTHIVDDLVGVADMLRPGEPAVLLGHDWGAPIVWNAALARPDRFRAVGALSIPYYGVPDRPLTELFHETYTARDRFYYQVYFEVEGPAEAEAEADVRAYLRRFYHALSADAPIGGWPKKPASAALLDGLADPPRPPAWMSQADLDYYATEFERSGFRGALNRYRNHVRDFHWQHSLGRIVIEQPALFISGTRDLAFNMRRAADPIADMRRHVPDLRVAEILDGCGHWTQQERPEEVNALLVPWLKSL
ncbi:alpha/beta fold hydrolase [Phenylobacterium sp.]|uniref:alpha/beta fold hydrolase n=1 Tax=Phenylobacterium sp. TaxID=1871053 RepID=UPI002FC624C0